MLLLLLSRVSRVRLSATPQTAATRLPCSQDSPGKNTGAGCHFLLLWIFPTQGLNPCLLGFLPWFFTTSVWTSNSTPGYIPNRTETFLHRSLHRSVHSNVIQVTKKQTQQEITELVPYLPNLKRHDTNKLTDKTETDSQTQRKTLC